MIDVKVGDTVIVTEHRRDPREAVVSKVGRVWVTVGEGWQERKFRLDDQSDGSNIGYGTHFYTPDQWAEKQRSDEASTYLREQGIEIGWTSPWRGREIELANVIRSVGERGHDPR